MLGMKTVVGFYNRAESLGLILDTINKSGNLDHGVGWRRECHWMEIYEEAISRVREEYG